MSIRTPQRTASQSSIPTGSAPHRLSLSAGGPNSSSGSLPIVSPSHGLPSLQSGSTSALSSFSVPPHASSSSLVNPTALALSHPHSSLSAPVSHVSYSAFAALTAEMTSTLARTSRQAIKKRRRATREIERAVWGKKQQQANTAATSKEHLEEEAEQLRKSLEAIGERTGASYAERLSRDRPPFLTTLDVLKFLCKEVWISLFEKQVDNLRTNHRGVYVLQDNAFKMVMRISASTAMSVSFSGGGSKTDSANETMRLAKLHLAYPVGLLRGILSRLGVPSVVVAEPVLSSTPVPSLSGPGGPSTGVQGQSSNGNSSSTTGQQQQQQPQQLFFAGAVTFHVKTGASANASAAQQAQPMTPAPSEGMAAGR